LVAVCRKAYEPDADGDIEPSFNDVWRKYQAQGISPETLDAARIAARPQVSKLYVGWLERNGRPNFPAALE
jgi:hypothetical protein